MIKQLKSRLYRYRTLHNTKRCVDALDLIVKQYNNKVHLATGYLPSKVNAKNRDQIFSYMYRRLISKPRPKPKLFPGDIFRISHKRLVFSKALLPGYSQETFTVKSVVPIWPIFTYTLVDKNGEQLESSYTESELSVVQRHDDTTANVQRDSAVQQTN